MITHMFGDSSSDSRDTCGCVLILEMSTKNALTNPDYAKGTKGKKKNISLFLNHLLIYYLNCRRR